MLLFRFAQVDITIPPITIPERAEAIVTTVKENPTLAAILLVVGLLTIALFFWGMMKQMFKAAIFGGVLSAIVWFWYFNIR